MTRAARTVPASALLLSLALAAAAFPQEGASSTSDASAKGRWSGRFDFGATGSAGNARAVTAVGGAKVRFDGARWKWELDGDGTVVDVKTNADEDGNHHEDHEIEANLHRTFGSRLYGLVKIRWDRKPNSGIASELKPGLGVGVLLAPSQSVDFRIEGGLAYVDERSSLGPPDLTYLSPFVHSRWVWTLPSGAALLWRNDLRFGTDEGSALKSDQELELDAPLSGRLSLGVVLEWERNSDPPDGLEKDDYRLVTKIIVAL